MVVMRVAYEVASIRNIQSKLNPNDLAKAKEMYLDAYPTLKPLENSTNVTRMPKKYKEGLELYFEDMKKLGNAH